MAKPFVEIIDRAIPGGISRTGEAYRVLLGDAAFEPDDPIVGPGSFNCGAVCDELEWARLALGGFASALDVAETDGGNLDQAVLALVDLPRNAQENDDTYRARFRALVTHQSYPRRTQRWDILQALSHLLDANRIRVIEDFDTYETYFQVRVVSISGQIGDLYVSDPAEGFIDSNYIQGLAAVAVTVLIPPIVNRIKAAGVDWDLVFAARMQATKTIDATIGSIQLYKTIDGHVMGTYSLTTTIDGEVL